MAARSSGPASPRVSAPDLPRVLERLTALAPRDDVLGVRLDELTGDVSIAHGRLAESRIDGASVARFDLTGAALSDVEVAGLRAVELSARDGSWRGVEVVGGRIGTLDGLRAQWDAVTLRGLRIDYLSLPSATLGDVLIDDCEIGTLDLPEATLGRVRFRSSRAEEVDTRGIRASDLDLRGLEALAYTDPRALAGAWLTPRQVETHAAEWARALGIRVAD
ncbi:hypothetical protein [Microbacterium flavum]|uniref:Pentapeptide repeat-containing protein n=1 Tax=Microbacterium flavum TaxID=415216 RepID=A0ABS5XVN8_9MICO|nr:hypothetical protein [Microbacterium flavum]MBT8798481.1 hypothetical protein [Microbacterium flavum]